jgi:phenylacetate-CoA ligase
MPFIRYAPGDLAVRSTIDCGCGRTLPVLDKIVGRTSDLIELPNGRIINGLSIPFESLTEHIVKFQLVHEEEDLLMLNYVPKQSISNEVCKQIRTILTENAGEGIRIELNAVEDIPQTKAGKFRYIISKVNRNENKVHNS